MALALRSNREARLAHARHSGPLAQTGEMKRNSSALLAARHITRDCQRSKFSDWERTSVRALAHSSIYDAEFATLDECVAYAEPIWRKERGRVGLANRQVPSIERQAWGQRRAMAHADHRITLPRWARSRWVILHELAHQLNAKHRGAAHGARFVGILIGLIARWLDCDAKKLMETADAMGVRYYVRSVGVVPVRGPAWHVERVIRQVGPLTEMDLACHLSLAEGIDITPPQVRGASLQLIRQRWARWLRRKLTLLACATL